LWFLSKNSTKQQKSIVMTGERVKALIIGKGYSVAQVAEMIGTSQQNLAANLKHTDVRSGLLEKIASALDVPLSVFYGETFGPVLSIRGSNNTQVAGTSNSVQSDSGLVLELLKMKDEQLLISMKQTCAVQEQMGRLIECICGPEKAEASGEV
jgi:transcriptional regulator with XRE-family HTH domain